VRDLSWYTVIIIILFKFVFLLSAWRSTSNSVWIQAV
jgi:hypothetical protein